MERLDDVGCARARTSAAAGRATYASALAGMVVGLALLTAASPAHAATPRRCRRTAARAALLAHGLNTTEHGRVAQVVCGDFTGDHRLDMAVTEATSGSAGVIGMAIFAETAKGWKLDLSRPDDYQPFLIRLGHQLLEYLPVYRKSDPECCHTGGTKDMLFAFVHGHFRIAYRWHQR